MEHPKNCLVCSVNKPTGRLENWSWKPGDNIVNGEVHDDIHHRWPDGRRIWTSQIMNMDVDSGHVRTMNSLYILGKRKEDK